jgi:hypothetical protein
MLPHDKRLALSAVEVEQLRDLRSRLNRATDKAIGPLMVGFFKVAERVGLAPAVVNAAGLDVLRATGGGAGDWIARVADLADIRLLQQLTAELHRLQKADPSAFTAAIKADAPQAVISRRLVLAGREPAKEVPAA